MSFLYFQETVLGQAVHWGSGRRLLRYPEAIDPNLSLQTLNESKEDLKEVGSDGKLDGNKVVTWYGPGDPANPQNWPFGRKIFVTMLICFLTFSIYIGSAIYTAGTEGIVREFNVSAVTATLGLTLFVLGYGVGPMFWAPIAESPPFGRTTVYMFTLLCFILLNFGVVYARNIGMLLAFRFLTGFFGSPVLATGGASMADLWSPPKRAYAIGIWGLFAVAGPTMGPLVGGFAVEAKGWTWCIWELIWLNGVCFVVLIICLPETSANNILFRRARRLREVTNDQSYKSVADIEAETLQIKDIVVASLLRPFQLCFREPILLATNVYLGLIYAILYCWFEAFPIVFGITYQFTLGQTGLAFLGLLVGAVIIMIPYCWWLYVYQEPQFDEDGNIEPEKRIPPAIAGSLFVPVCMFWFGWSSRADVHWIVPIIGSSFFPMGAVLLFNAILNYQGDAYPEYIGSVLAGNDLMRAAFGACFPLFATAMFNNLGVDWGTSMLGFFSIAFIPIPILLQVYGKRLRMASKYARHDI